MHLEFPCPILLHSSFAEAARRLGISEQAVNDISWGNSALRDGRVMDRVAFDAAFPDEDFDDFSGDQRFPPDLLVASIEVPRDPSLPFAPPITARDRAAAAAWLAIRRYRRLKELGAPSILLAAERSNLRSACAPIDDAWQPMSELMTGGPAQPGAAGEAHPMFGVPFGELDATVPLDVAFLPEGFAVLWPYATVVFGPDGVVRDVFPTRGQRVIGGDSRFVGLVCGGGSASHSGYFGAEVSVRDLSNRTWLPRGASIPPAVPRYVAGTIGDVKWAVVVDTLEGVGYRTSPVTSGDQCGETFNSACGQFAWDRGRFVLEAATGEAVLDVRPLEGRLINFAKGANGWRFVMQDEPPEDAPPEGVEEPPILFRLKDETNTVIRSLDRAVMACALSADATRLVEVTTDELTVRHADSGQVMVAFDLSPFANALRLPRDGELWQNLAAVFGTPSQLEGQRVDGLRAALEGLWGTFEDADLAEAIREGTKWPPLPARAPVRSSVR